MQTVRAALDQLRMDCGASMAAAMVWMSGSGPGGLFVLFPLILLALWRRGRRTGELRQGVI